MPPSLSLALGLALLFVGGELLVRGASALALRTGMSPLAVGLTVVAFGTSSPELAVSLQAALGGMGDVAAGNVVGSNICNVGLILGLAALIRPLATDVRLVRVDVPLVIGASLALVAVLWDGRASRLEGALLTLGIVAYLAYSLWEARRLRPAAVTPVPGLPAAPASLGADLLRIVGGLAALVVGGDLLVEGAVALARSAGLSEALIGLTVVALGTSLPELATSVIAALRDETDIAVGNVVGSNLFNILGILGPTAVLAPLGAEGIVGVDLATMVVLALLLLPLARSGGRVSRGEGAALLLVYVGYVTWRAAGMAGG